MAAASKTTKKSSAGTGMAVWEAELAKRAEASAKTAQSVSAGYKSISTRSGAFSARLLPRPRLRLLSPLQAADLLSPYIGRLPQPSSLE